MNRVPQVGEGFNAQDGVDGLAGLGIINLPAAIVESDENGIGGHGRERRLADAALAIDQDFLALGRISPCGY